MRRTQCHIGVLAPVWSGRAIGYVLLLAVIGSLAVLRSDRLTWLLPAKLVGSEKRTAPVR